MPKHQSRPINHHSSLCVEEFECRLLLSSVGILASGETGQEQFALLVDGQAVAQYNAGQQTSTFEYQTAQNLAPEQIRIEFLNDAYDPAQGLDRNLSIDSIRIDGVTFETEDTSVFSTGTYRQSDGLVSGFGRGETLHVNGYFQYGAQQNSGSLIEVRARGDEGGEQFNLIVNGANVGTYTTSTTNDSFFYQAGGDVSTDDVRIEFFGAQYNPGTGLDDNLFVDFVRIDGATFQTEESSVFSTGSWRASDGIVPGFGRGEYLHDNGYFQYAGSTNSGSIIEVVARGSEGGEQFNLIVSGQNAGTFTAGNSNQGFFYQASGNISASDIRIEFINDIYDPANSIDRNLIVDFIRIDGEVFQTESPDVFSTGTWTRDDGIVDGFGRGETLNTNGVFNFGALPENARYRVTFDATWSSSTHPGGFPPGAHFSGLVGATHNEQVQFWAPGEQATPGIEDVAELGSKTSLTAEVNSAIGIGTAENLLSGGGITLSPDSVSLEFDASVDHALVTLVSMLAPSPDWFVGVHGLSLLNNGGWIGNSTIQLDAYDAGTDNGLSFNSPDVDNTGGTITRITSGPLANNGSVAPLGTFRFERIG